MGGCSVNIPLLIALSCYLAWEAQSLSTLAVCLVFVAIVAPIARNRS